MILPQAIVETFPESWPPALAALGVPTVSKRLGDEDAWALGGHSSWFRRATGAPPRAFSAALLGWIDATMDAMPEGASPRTGLCSWKDAGTAALPAYGRRGVVHTITADSERVGRAMAAHVASGRPAFLHLRRWRVIPPEREFRAFLRGGRVAGVTQMHAEGTYPALLAEGDALVEALRAFLAPLRRALHLEDCAADICLDPEGPFLIEVNPLLRATDLGLFSWDRADDLDGTLRLRDGMGVVKLRPGG